MAEEQDSMTNDFRELDVVRCTDQIITTMARWPVDIEIKIAALNSAASILSNSIGAKAQLIALNNILNPNGRR